MARSKGIAEFAVNFEPTGQSPLDAREQVETLADLYTAFNDGNNYYDKMIVTVKDEEKQYMLVDISHRNDSTGWKKVNPSLEELGIDVSAEELNYLEGVTSNIQEQLNNKAELTDLNDYLPLTGGTITGNLTVENSLMVGETNVSLEGHTHTVANITDFANNIKTVNGQSLIGSGNVTIWTDVPTDDRIYARSNGEWLDITEYITWNEVE